MFVATRLLRCRQVDAIMKSAWKCGAGEKAEALGHLKCRSEYHSKLHKNLIITMCLVIVTMYAQYCEESCGALTPYYLNSSKIFGECRNFRSC